jgi:septal ring-binding cell division protein DamX
MNPPQIEGMVRFAIILLGLTGAPAMAQPEADRQDQRWVCVPDENRQWRCGRGDQAPEPRPLPPARPEGAAPDGYDPPVADTGLPDYLRQTPNQSAESLEADTASTAGSDQEPEATPEATRDTASGTMVEDVEAAPEPEAGTGPATGSARYGIQLIAGRDRASVEAYRVRLGLKDLEVYRRTWEDAGGLWHVLLAGRFETVEAALRALDSLPANMRQAGAWVRPLDELDIPTDHSRNTESD